MAASVFELVWLTERRLQSQTFPAFLVVAVVGAGIGVVAGVSVVVNGGLIVGAVVGWAVMANVVAGAGVIMFAVIMVGVSMGAVVVDVAVGVGVVAAAGISVVAGAVYGRLSQPGSRVYF